MTAALVVGAAIGPAQAQDTIKTSLIGVIVIALAYGITAFVFNKLGGTS